ncbi:MAG TPA: hypothetical protein DFR83_14120, partial [Deltaproteobacteria bacterium]|nr:hypothetical protein [Deltaproteobacteria bacterium]
MSRRVIWGATLGLVVTTVAAAVERPGAGDPQPPTGTGEGGRWDRGVASAMHAPPTWRGSRASGVFAGQRVVGIHASTDPLAVAAELGLSVDAIDRNHNIALFSGHEHHLDALQNHEHVVSVHANGRIQAAGVGGRVGPVMGEQRAWHRSGANVPDAVDGLSDVIVAVLDTGVAYRTWCGDAPCAADATPTHQPVPGLDGVAIVAPMDFVDGDAVPLDEHQHGTHIASTILSQGAHRGVAAGAALMPVRVLDASGVGSEFDLILGIHHAIDHGANIISIGGTFAADFRPSSLLCDALDAASEASLVVLAPTGNDGLEQVSWPAAAPSVIAVAASAPEPDFHRLQDPWQTTGIARLAPYANASAAVDVVAPGGDLRFDRTGDGLPDGVLAETIAPADPSEIGHWLLAGTSHATAITAGAAARALALGARPKSVAWALQRPARPLRQE